MTNDEKEVKPAKLTMSVESQDTRPNMAPQPYSVPYYQIIQFVCCIYSMYYIIQYMSPNSSFLGTIGYLIVGCCCSPCFATWALFQKKSSPKGNVKKMGYKYK